jgi:hypothetical protein
MNWLNGMMLGTLVLLGAAAVLAFLAYLRAHDRAEREHADAERWRAQEQKRQDVEALMKEARAGLDDFRLDVRPAFDVFIIDRDGLGAVTFVNGREDAAPLARRMQAQLAASASAPLRDDGPPSGMRHTRAQVARASAEAAHAARYLRHIQEHHQAQEDDLAAEHARALARRAPRPHDDRALVPVVLTTTTPLRGNDGALGHAG